MKAIEYYAVGLADPVSVVELETPRLVVLGDFNINAKDIEDRSAQSFLPTMATLCLSQSNIWALRRVGEGAIT